jgi:hypothetical protein
VVDVALEYGVMPVEKITELYELINHLNNLLTVNHYCIDHEKRKLALRAGFFVTGYFLDKKDFKMFLNFLLGTGQTLKPLIDKLLTTEETPWSIMESMNAICSEADALKKGFEESKKTEERPFIIHHSFDLPLRPTHTHGLTEVGLPEFIMANEPIGADGITSMMNLTYDDFISQESDGKLDRIRNGERLQCKMGHTNPDGQDVIFILCFCRIDPESEIVKRAYEIEDPKDLDPKMWIIKIYVEDIHLTPTDND